MPSFYSNFFLSVPESPLTISSFHCSLPHTPQRNSSLSTTKAHASFSKTAQDLHCSLREHFTHAFCNNLDSVYLSSCVIPDSKKCDSKQKADLGRLVCTLFFFLRVNTTADSSWKNLPRSMEGRKWTLYILQK